MRLLWPIKTETEWHIWERWGINKHNSSFSKSKLCVLLTANRFKHKPEYDRRLWRFWLIDEAKALSPTNRTAAALLNVSVIAFGRLKVVSAVWCRTMTACRSSLDENDSNTCGFEPSNIVVFLVAMMRLCTNGRAAFWYACSTLYLAESPARNGLIYDILVYIYVGTPFNHTMWLDFSSWNRIIIVWFHTHSWIIECTPELNRLQINSRVLHPSTPRRWRTNRHKDTVGIADGFKSCSLSVLISVCPVRRWGNVWRVAGWLTGSLLRLRAKKCIHYTSDAVYYNSVCARNVVADVLPCKHMHLAIMFACAPFLL